MSDLWKKGAAEIARLVTSGEVTAREVTESRPRPAGSSESEAECRYPADG